MDLTPKQQVTELLKQAQNILIVTGREPNNDQLASSVALQSVLTKLGKSANVVITDKLPRLAQVIDTSMVATDLKGARDFVVGINMHDVQVDKVRYDVNGTKLDITITPHGGNFTQEDVVFSYGAYQFDLVVALGVPSISRLDRLHEQNPTIFDGYHLLNIDYHRINENYGSVNLVDPFATCVAEILISVIESLGQGMIDPQIATAFLGSFMSATANFTAPSTTAKALTIAAQMMSAGGKQQEIVKALNMGPQLNQAPAREQRAENSKQGIIPRTYTKTEEPKPAAKSSDETPTPTKPAEKESSVNSSERDSSKKNSNSVTAMTSSNSQVSASDLGRVESAPPEVTVATTPLRSIQATTPSINLNLSPLEIPTPANSAV